MGPGAPFLLPPALGHEGFRRRRGPSAPGLAYYGGLCARVWHAAHARSGDAIAITSYLGTSDTFDGAVADLAETYADLNERDHKAYVEAIASGRLSTVPPVQADPAQSASLSRPAWAGLWRSDTPSPPG